MNFTKSVGWFLLFTGIMIILYSLYSSYLIFSNSKSIPEIFKNVSIGSTSHNKSIPTNLTKEEITRLALQKTLDNFFPAGSQSNLLNLIAWSIFAGILILGGSQISALGIKLIKR